MTGGRTSKTRPGWTAGRRCLRQRPKCAVALHDSCLLIIIIIIILWVHVDEKNAQMVE